MLQNDTNLFRRIDCTNVASGRDGRQHEYPVGGDPLAAAGRQAGRQEGGQAGRRAGRQAGGRAGKRADCVDRSLAPCHSRKTENKNSHISLQFGLPYGILQCCLFFPSPCSVVSADLPSAGNVCCACHSGHDSKNNTVAKMSEGAAAPKTVTVDSDQRRALVHTYGQSFPNCVLSHKAGKCVMVSEEQVALHRRRRMLENAGVAVSFECVFVFESERKGVRGALCVSMCACCFCGTSVAEGQGMGWRLAVASANTTDTS